MVGKACAGAAVWKVRNDAARLLPGTALHLHGADSGLEAGCFSLKSPNGRDAPAPLVAVGA